MKKCHCEVAIDRNCSKTDILAEAVLVLGSRSSVDSIVTSAFTGGGGSGGSSALNLFKVSFITFHKPKSPGGEKSDLSFR